MQPIRIAIIGLGKIAHDQHLPALAADRMFALVASVDPAAPALPGLPHFPDVAALRASGLMVDAVSIATPPGVRAGIAAQAAGWHVMLEKPPAATPAQAAGLRASAGRSLMFAWHSRCASAVAAARTALAGETVTNVAITWHEDWRVWHPGQDWIWRADGFGVFDAGINALSILTHLFPGVLLDSAALTVPAGCAAPIAARLALSGPDGCAITADFDWRIAGPQCWDIAIACASGRRLRLSDGGARLWLDGEAQAMAEPKGEYPALYRRFAALIAAGRSDTDLSPLALVAQALAIGAIHQCEAL
ncbi:Gfo/Idh/MocA family oxidoreductase [Sandarakinorhabdus sp.]|uniref:Gfo/Idh/MocA family oxidoreductase n=1 Tax=Sandarakinorhabdus sp. TaxID=1916663 RepID=UPI00286E4F8A|nr:Gfo/Idh/MocA family oxidoreductase [Sandarakinorhabdus sp.]